MIAAANRTNCLQDSKGEISIGIPASGPCVDPTSRPSWASNPDSYKALRAKNIALDVADRLRDPARVEQAVLQARLQSDNPTGPQWTQYGFAQGYAGLVLLWGHLDRCFPGQGWDAVAHEHLQIAAEGAAMQNWISPGAFSGIGGLAFAADYVSCSGARYGKLLRTLEDGMVRSLAPHIAYLNNLNHGAPTSAFDLISGLSGTVPFLLSRRESPEVERTLTEVVRSLIAVTNEDDGLPRWHSPPNFSKPADDFMLQQYPDGYLNCGLAHGVPGPLGALALADLQGVECEGLAEAIDRAAAWLVEHRVDDEWGLNWPSGLGLRPPGDPAGRILDTVPSGPAQAGWCYGSPGVARSLYHAGVCLRRQDYCELAVKAIECVLKRPRSARRLESPTFCHGVSGLLEIVLRFAHDTGSETIAVGASALIDQILPMFEPETMLGFRSMEFAGKRVDQPGLLDGAPGAALVMLSIACDAEPTWDRIFLLS